MANANLYHLLQQQFSQNPDKIAFHLENGGRLNYRTLSESVAQMANHLEQLGVGPGDRVTVQIEKSLTNVVIYLASLKIGAVYHPLNTAYTAGEVDFFVGDASPKILIVDPSKIEALKPVAHAHGVKHLIDVDGDGRGDWDSALMAQSKSHKTYPSASDDLACLLYTSGTTGRSKGAMITHGNLISNTLTLHQYWAFEEGDVLLHALPIYHVHGLQVALHTALYNVSEIIWLVKFDAQKVIETMPKASVMMGVPTFYTRLLESDNFTKDCVRGMRLFISGSAPLLAETHKAFEARTDMKILERYGMTETGMMTSNPYHGERVAGTVGFALPDISIRVASEKGEVLGPGETGVIEVKGPNVFKGYWQLPEKTAEEFRSDGYFITGDLGIADNEGRITIVGREKDMIITGGFNVYPKEIESMLDEMEGIYESAVFGVPHPDFGEGVVAVVTTETGNGKDTGSPDTAKMIEFLAQKIAKFKMPKHIFVIGALPRNAMGKVQKAQLRETYRDLFQGH